MTKLLTLNGKTQSQNKWSRELHIAAATIIKRLRLGLPIEQVLRPVPAKPFKPWPGWWLVTRRADNRRVSAYIKRRNPGGNMACVPDGTRHSVHIWYSLDEFFGDWVQNRACRRSFCLQCGQWLPLRTFCAPCTKNRRERAAAASRAHYRRWKAAQWAMDTLTLSAMIGGQA